MYFLRGFILKQREKAYAFLKNDIGDFQNSPEFERSGYFYVTISENFEGFKYFNLEINFLKNENLFQKAGASFSKWKY